jgi:hypothetical protein
MTNLLQWSVGTTVRQWSAVRTRFPFLRWVENGHRRSKIVLMQRDEEEIISLMRTKKKSRQYVMDRPLLVLQTNAASIPALSSDSSGRKTDCDLMEEIERLNKRIQTLTDQASNDKHEIATMLSALALAHQHIRQLAAATYSPEENVKAMSEFLRTHHKARITFEQ